MRGRHIDSVNINVREEGVVSATTRTNYHHGDARNALLRAAAELLEATGAAGLSLRQLSDRAGLSRQASYNHFADKEALLAELVCNGFRRLGQELEAAGRDNVEPAVRPPRSRTCTPPSQRWSRRKPWRTSAWSPGRWCTATPPCASKPG